jgi:hypothetical protein
MRRTLLQHRVLALRRNQAHRESGRLLHSQNWRFQEVSPSQSVAAA